MNTINVIFAVNQTTWNALKQNFQYNENGTRVREDLTETQARKLRTNISGHWKTPDIGGTIYHVVSWYVPLIYIDPENPTSGLKWVEFLLTEFPGKFHIIGAWNKDGSMFGTALRQQENGVDSIETQDRIITMVDKQVLDIEATIANEAETFKTVQVEEISYIDSGVFIDIPHFDTVVDGTPVYPIHAQYMKIFPDVDEQPAIIPAEVNKVLGWSDRRWA